MPSVTFKPIIVTSNRHKDGSWPVKIRVTYKGVSRRLPTTLICYAHDVSRNRKIRNNDIIRKGQELCDQMAATLRDVSPFTLEDWDVDRVVRHVRDSMKSTAFSLDYFAFGARYAESKKEVTRRAYTAALGAFSRFLGKTELDINAITKSMLLDFVDWNEKQPKLHYVAATGKYTKSKKAKVAQGSSSRHLMKLAKIFNAAKERYNDEDAGVLLIPRSPFASIPKPQPPAHGQENQGVEVVQRMIDAQTGDPAERRAIDAWLLSFCLMGVNLADLYAAIPPKDGTWIYFRQKTAEKRADRAEMRVEIPPQAQPYLERLGAGTSTAWWLPELRAMGKDKDTATARINRCLKRWQEREGLEPFTFGAARHTWASLALSKAKVEKAKVDEGLAHKGDFPITDIYAERDWEGINEANSKVLALFRW
jgi:hypothetical protein